MIEINNTTSRKINIGRIKKITENFSKKYKIKEGVSLAVIGDRKMKQLNCLYRGQDKITDILTFVDLNEIIINFNQIVRQAQEGKKKIWDEFEFMFVHGLLHLSGFDDSNEKDRLKMIELGDNFLFSLK